MSDKKGLFLKYFDLNPSKDDAYGQASRDAVMRYAQSIETTNALLAQELVSWLRDIEEEASSKWYECDECGRRWRARVFGETRCFYCDADASSVHWSPTVAPSTAGR